MVERYLDETRTIPEYMGWLRRTKTPDLQQQYANRYWAVVIGDYTRAEFYAEKRWSQIARSVQDAISYDIRHLHDFGITGGYLYRHRERHRRIQERRRETLARQRHLPWTQPRDSQRQKLYDAEKFLRTRGIEFHSIEEIQSYVDKVISSAWWRRRCSISRMRVVHQRSNASAMANGDGSISMPEWAWCESIVLHEMCHHMTDHIYGRVAFHGREFARTLLELVGHKMGESHRRDLKASFVEHKVKHSLPRKPMSEEQRAKAAQRLEMARAAQHRGKDS